MPRRRTSGASPVTSPKRLRRSDRLADSRRVRNGLLGNDLAGRISVLSDSAFASFVPSLMEVDQQDQKSTELRPRELHLYPHENKHAHHTEEYDDDYLVLRRGQDFDLAVTFDRPFDKETDSILLQFTTGSRPRETKGSLVRINVQEDYAAVKDDWQAKVTSTEENTVEMRVISPADCLIGRFHIYVETTTSDGDNRYQNRKEFEETFIMIFNPWCIGDSVYMEEDERRAEYVLNDTGRIWQGSSRSFYGKPWIFGQFEPESLDSALYLLDKAELLEQAKSNPVLVVRAMSQMANSNDSDGGVLEGRWSDPYPKGTTMPWSWSGSVAILKQFWTTKKTVKFGQCWVFSGLVTTLCRTLGIPTRSVTNFESAHDTDASMTIDYHWNEDDEPVSDLNDSVWNFHVWNETWLKRPDLPEGYDGWQAVDATPQEASEGVMKCGPSPVKAIRDGHVYLPYDTKFIFAEVNGDKVHWLVRKDGTINALEVESRGVGAYISTKAVGSKAREDLTLHYKYKEGSAEERSSVHRAFRYSTRKEHKVYQVDKPDVKFDLISPEHVAIGDDFELKVVLKNTSGEERNVHAGLQAVASFYTGVPSAKVGTKQFTEKLKPNEEKTVSLPVSAEDYVHILKPESMMTVYLKGSVKETGRSYAHIDKVAITKPELMISVPEKVSLKEEFEVDIHLTNPLHEKLTGGEFHIEASRGLDMPFVLPYKKAIPAGEEVVVKLKTSSTKSGNREIVVNFSCDQMSGLNGSAEIYVAYSAF